MHPNFLSFPFLVAKMPGHHPLHKAPEKGLKSLLPYLQATLKRDLTQYEQDLLSYPRLCNVCLDGNQVRDHPYITSAHFWTFFAPPTYPTSA